MHFALVNTIYCRGIISKLLAGYLVYYHRLLNQTVEKLAAGTRCATVKAKGKLVKIVIEVRRSHRALVRSDEPAFQQRGHPICQRKKILAHICRLSHYLMNITRSSKIVVSVPAIGSNDIARFHRSLYGFTQAFARCIGYPTQSNPAYATPVLLGCYNHQCLSFRASAPFPTLFASDIRFIHFYDSCQSISAGANHGHSQLMHPCPRRSVASEPQHSLQSQCANPIFLIYHIPDSIEPYLQGLTSALEDSTCGHRSLVVAELAPVQASFHLPRLRASATRTDKSVRVSQLPKIIAACLFGGEPLLKLHSILWIIGHNTTILHIVCTRVKCIGLIYYLATVTFQQVL